MVQIDLSQSDFADGPIRHKELPGSFIKRVKRFKEVLAEVDHSSLQLTIDNFKMDLKPENELKAWEEIASAYQWTTVRNPGLSLDQKKDVFAVILGISVGAKTFSNIKHLTPEKVSEILEIYGK